MNCVTDSSLSLLTKQCADFSLVTKQSDCAILNCYCRVCFCLVRLQTKMLNEFTILRLQRPSLLIDQTIPNVHPSHPTIQCSQSSHLALCSVVCTVRRVHCAAWCTVQCTVVCSVRCAECNGVCCETIAHSKFLWRALLHYKCALPP